MKYLNNWTIFALRLHESLKKCSLFSERNQFCLSRKSISFLVGFTQFQSTFINFEIFINNNPKRFNTITFPDLIFNLFLCLPILIYVYNPKLSDGIYLCSISYNYFQTHITSIGFYSSDFKAFSKF